MRKFLLILISVFALGSTAAVGETGQYDGPVYTDDQLATAYAVDVESFTVSDRDRVVEEMRSVLDDQYRTAEKTDQALSRLVKFAVFQLRRNGYDEDADELQNEYSVYYEFAVRNFYLNVVPVDLGDHEPLSQWLADWYDKLEARLGPFIMELTHLDDIKVFNYAIPVVFHPTGWHGDSWDIDEYRLHFVPLSGVVAYWTSWGVCVGATWGMGMITFICTPVGMICEHLVVKYVAPPISDRVYCRFNECR